MTRRFLTGERGSVALESALALVILVGAFGGLMHITGSVFAEDRVGGGARAVARAIALNPNADPWDVLRREGALSATAACPKWPSTASAAGACGGWTLFVARGLSTKGLLGAAHGMHAEVVRFLRDSGADVVGGGPAGAPGEMVLVVLERPASAWSFGGIVPDANANTNTADQDAGATMTALGLARSEPRS